MDFLKKIRENNTFFVIRTKSNTQYRIVERRKKTGSGVRADWIVEITGSKAKDYSEELRVIRYYDADTKQTYEYYTNNFNLSVKTIADIYKSRWDIEIFFKFIKQNLKIKSFFGTSENAVRIQIWSAMIALLLVEYIRFKCRSTFSFQKSWRILKDNVFQQYRIESLLAELLVSKQKIKLSTDVQLSLRIQIIKDSSDFNLRIRNNYEI